MANNTTDIGTHAINNLSKMDIEDTIFKSDWDDFDKVNKDCNDFDPELDEVCVENIVYDVDMTITRYIVADTPNIDNSVSAIANQKYGFNLSRISRLCNVIYFDHEDSTIFKKENKHYTCIFNIRDDRSNKTDTHTKSQFKIVVINNNKMKSIILTLNKYVIIPPQSSFYMIGTSSYAAILMYEQSDNLYLPLINNINKDSVYLSRYSRIHDELPNYDWFKFYISFGSDFTSTINIIINGTVINALASYDTHCKISNCCAYEGFFYTTDCCRCCYKNVPLIKEMSANELISTTSCEHYKSGLLLKIKDIGTFTASYIGRCPNFKHIRMVTSIVDFMINDKSMFAGQKMHSTYLYGIAHV
ncbi:hypothetical protein [Hypsugopox virus]|nr:hypothetical protein [Hypsugopox virus]